MTWYTLIYCRPPADVTFGEIWTIIIIVIVTAKTILSNDNNEPDCGLSSLQSMVRMMMLLLCEEWQRRAGYRFPQQTVTLPTSLLATLYHNTTHFSVNTTHTIPQHHTLPILLATQCTLTTKYTKLCAHPRHNTTHYTLATVPYHWPHSTRHSM